MPAGPGVRLLLCRGFGVVEQVEEDLFGDQAYAELPGGVGLAGLAVGVGGYDECC